MLVNAAAANTARGSWSMAITHWLVKGSGNLSDALGNNVFLSNRKTLNYHKSNRATPLIHLLQLFFFFKKIGRTEWRQFGWAIALETVYLQQPLRLTWSLGTWRKTFTYRMDKAVLVDADTNGKLCPSLLFQVSQKFGEPVCSQLVKTKHLIVRATDAHFSRRVSQFHQRSSLVQDELHV